MVINPTWRLRREVRGGSRTNATPTLISNRVDHTMQAVLKYPNGVISHLKCSLSAWYLGLTYSAVGEKGSLNVFNFAVPSIYHYLTVTTNGKSVTEKVYGNGGTTYMYQLEGFYKAVKGDIKKSE
jgi:predicted dehydrogenase